MKPYLLRHISGIIAVVLVGLGVSIQGQGQAPAQGRQGGRGGAAAAPVPAGPPTGSRLEFTTGTIARYKAQEQLAGVDFPSEAVGSTTAVKGTVVLRADGTIDSAQSKITVDLTTLTSDQALRDNYIRRAVLEVEKFPMLEFVPKRTIGLKVPVPYAQRQENIGFQLVGDMTIHGVTKEVTWKVVGSASANAIAGRALTSFQFSDFGMTKPSVAFVLSVEDRVDLEVEFRTTRTAL